MVSYCDTYTIPYLSSYNTHKTYNLHYRHVCIFIVVLRRRQHHNTQGAHVVTKQTGYYAGFPSPHNGVQRPKFLTKYNKRELPVTPRATAPPDSPTPYESEENEYSYIADVAPHTTQGSTSHGPSKYFELDPEETKRHPQVMARVNDRYVLSGRASPIRDAPVPFSTAFVPTNYSPTCSQRVCIGGPPPIGISVQGPPLTRRVLASLSSFNTTGLHPEVLSTTSNVCTGK